MDLGFDRSLERRQQEAQGRSEPHFLVAELDPALDAAAVEIEVIAVPTMTDAEFFGHSLGDTLDSSARVFHAARMRVMDIDIGHRHILRFARSAC